MPEDFFQQEQKMAVEAMTNCCREAWEVIKQDTNVNPLIRQRPLASLAAAAAGGLVAGYLLTPPRGGRPKPERHDHDDDHDDKQKRRKQKQHRGFLVTLEDELASAITPTLRTFAATTAGALFSGFHQGYSQGTQPEPPMPGDIPGHRIQI